MKRSVFLLPVLLASQPIQGADVTLTVGNTPGFPGLGSSVPVFLSPASNVVVAQFEVSFDPAKVWPAGLGESAGTHRVSSREVAPGQWKILTYSLQPQGTNNVAAKLPFELSVQEHVDSGPIQPSQAVLLDKTERELSVELEGGVIFARPVNRLANGTVDFFLPSQPGSNYSIQASSNLFDWEELFTNQATGTWMDLHDGQGALYPYRFYRWEQLP